MFSCLPKDFKKLFRTGTGKGQRSFEVNIGAASTDALQKYESKTSGEDEKLLQRQDDNDDLPQRTFIPHAINL